jgi:hypothetical protein
MFDMFQRDDGTWGVFIDDHGTANSFANQADAQEFVAEVARAAVGYIGAFGEMLVQDPPGFLRHFLKPELPKGWGDDIRRCKGDLLLAMRLQKCAAEGGQTAVNLMIQRLQNRAQRRVAHESQR